VPPISQRFVGVSVVSRAVDDDIECAIRSEANVLITGESGVEKESVAHLIYDRSYSRPTALVTINCSGISETSMASQLRAHVRGNFTDVHVDNQSGIEQAYERTIFLNELDDVSWDGQSVLLGFLESGEIQPTGSDGRAAFGKVRMIATAGRRLDERVVTGEFRDDLFYRLNTIHIEIPPPLDR